MDRDLLAAVDHLVYATPDLESTVMEMGRRFGVEPAPGGRHERWGTRNAILGLGPSSYLEIIGPDPERRASSASPTVFGLAERTGASLVAWSCAVDDIEASVRAAKGRGVRLGTVLEGSRERPTGERLRWRLTDPGVVIEGGLVPFLIEWGESEHPATSAPRGGTLTRLELEGPHPEPARQALAALGIRLPVARAASLAIRATVETRAGILRLE